MGSGDSTNVPIVINDKSFDLRVIRTGNRHGYARVYNGSVVVSVPSRLVGDEYDEMVEYLCNRIRELVERHPNRFVGDGFSLYGVEQTHPLGSDIRIIRNVGRRAGLRVVGNEIHLSMPEHIDDDIARKMSDSLVVRGISRIVNSSLESRVNAINSRYYGFEIRGVRIRLNRGVWGSISANRIISLNLKLLYAPSDVLDYVIAHELAHVRYSGHGVRFWKLVERAVPDHTEKRVWLRENGQLIRPF